MANFAELIRYGFPGYLLVGAILASLMVTGTLSLDLKDPSAIEVAASIAVIVVGPFIGYLVHQLYFSIFDALESYDKTKRACVGAISRICASSVSGGDRLSHEERERLAYAAWKFVMTNMWPEAKVSDVFLRRLSSLHEYQHAFGAIMLGATLGILALVPAVLSPGTGYLADVCMVAPLVAIIVMFGVKRREVSSRADLFERVAVLQHGDAFRQFMQHVLARNSAMQVVTLWPPVEETTEAPVTEVGNEGASA